MNFDLPDWFSQHIPNWEHWVSPLNNTIRGRPQILEIGSAEGRSALWLLNNLKDSDIVCVDPFTVDSFLDAGIDNTLANRTAANFFENTKEFAKSRLTYINETSWEALMQLLPKREWHSFDVIYIDGSHTARDVLKDIVLAWELLNPGGVMILDDYQWTAPSGRLLDTPRLAIDCFLQIYQGKYTVLGIGIQVAVRKR